VIFLDLNRLNFFTSHSLMTLRVSNELCRCLFGDVIIAHIVPHNSTDMYRIAPNVSFIVQCISKDLQICIAVTIFYSAHCRWYKKTNEFESDNFWKNMATLLVFSEHCVENIGIICFHCKCSVAAGTENRSCRYALASRRRRFRFIVVILFEEFLS